MSETLEKENLILRRENLKLQEENFMVKKKNSDIEVKMEELEKISHDYEIKMSVISRYTFKPYTGIVYDSNGIHHCTNCLLSFKEIKLKAYSGYIKCPECGAKYPEKD